MDFAFYDEVGAASALGRVLVPVRRLARRVMRPVAYRLRDLLQYLSDQQDQLRHGLAATDAAVADLAARHRAAAAAHADAQALRAEVAALRAEAGALRDAAAAHAGALEALRAETADLREQARRQRPLHADYRGLAHRLDRVEDAVQQLHARE